MLDSQQRMGAVGCRQAMYDAAVLHEGSHSSFGGVRPNLRFGKLLVRCYFWIVPVWTESTYRAQDFQEGGR